MGENWAAFSPSCKGKLLPNLQEKNGQHFVLLLYKIYPKNYNRLSLNYGTLLASHSAVPRPLRQFNFAVLLAPPPDICLRSMGRALLLFLPLPWIPSGSQGMGHLEVDGNSTLIYLEETGATRPKDKLDLS